MGKSLYSLDINLDIETGYTTLDGQDPHPTLPTEKESEFFTGCDSCDNARQYFKDLVAAYLGSDAEFDFGQYSWMATKTVIIDGEPWQQYVNCWVDQRITQDCEEPDDLWFQL